MSQDVRVYIVLVNWNGWQDTIECLESLFRLDYDNYRIIICDNASSDDSVSRIIDWSQGRLEAPVGADGSLGYLTRPPVEKPLTYATYDRAEAESGGLTTADPDLTIVQSGKNLGFAGGCNVAMRYVLARGDAANIWLLNNDTVVEPEALKALVTRCLGDATIGICGSTLRYYAWPEIIQAQGGVRYNRWTGIARNLGYRLPISRELSEKQVCERLDYVHGASMLVSMPFIRDIGLMDESYFLYFEEIDWAVRLSGKYKLGYARESIVYHKEGASIGSKSSPDSGKQFRSEYYLVQSRLRFTRNFFPWALPGIYLGFLCTLFVRLCRGQFSRVAMMIKALCVLRAVGQP